MAFVCLTIAAWQPLSTSFRPPLLTQSTLSSTLDCRGIADGVMCPHIKSITRWTAAGLQMAASDDQDGTWQEVSEDLETAVKRAKAFGLPPLARWRLDEALTAANRAKQKLSRGQQELSDKTSEAAKALADAAKALEERDAATTRAATAAELAEAATATARAARVEASQAVSERDAAMERASAAEAAEATMRRCLEEAECEVEATREELKEGRRAAAELYGELNDALEKEQDTLSGAQQELKQKAEEAAKALAEAAKALEARDAAEARAVTAEEAAAAAGAVAEVERVKTESALQRALADAQANSLKLSAEMTKVREVTTRAATAEEALVAATAATAAAKAEAAATTQRLKMESATAAAQSERMVAELLSERDAALLRATTAEADYAEATRKVGVGERLQRLISRARNLLRRRRSD